MNKREFLQTACVAGLAAGELILTSAGKSTGSLPVNGKPRHWVWTRPNPADRDADLERLYKSYREAGIRGIFFEDDSERHFRIARKCQLEAHRWMWIMNRGEKELLARHPEWYAVSRSGKSCATDPPYVGYYRWLCPSRPEVLTYLREQITESLQKEYVDGIHFDYIRFCDVILPVNLWSNYGITQQQELPEYDFCYCAVCREKFRAEYGKDIMSIEYPDQSLSWRKFRYDAITHVVNSLSAVAATFKKPSSAAVFPTPEVAKRIVRQDWTNWTLNAVYPMIYHGFYKEEVSWIGDAVEEGVKALHGKFPLYAGLFIPDFKTHDELAAGIKTALDHGAAGISLFGTIDPAILKLLKEHGS